MKKRNFESVTVLNTQENFEYAIFLESQGLSFVVKGNKIVISLHDRYPFANNVKNLKKQLGF